MRLTESEKMASPRPISAGCVPIHITISDVIHTEQIDQMARTYVNRRRNRIVMNPDGDTPDEIRFYTDDVEFTSDVILSGTLTTNVTGERFSVISDIFTGAYHTPLSADASDAVLPTPPKAPIWTPKRRR